MKRDYFYLTKTAVKLRKVENRDAWHLFIEASPIIENGKLTRKRTQINKIITTPQWDKSKPTRGRDGSIVGYLPKRDKNGVIQCNSQKDKESCVLADKLRQQWQQEFDRQHSR